MKVETQVLIIGGGITGAGVLRDLSLRGIEAVLVERRDFNAGASGANHGLLHSGGRYVVTDEASARECIQENQILKRVASGCIEDTGGLFVALPGDDEKHIADFQSAAKRLGLCVENLDIKQALEWEPFLNPKITVALRVPDASINPFLATRANLFAAQSLGARVLLHTQIIAVKREGGRIVRVEAVRRPGGEVVKIYPNQVVNAAGPWVDQIGALVGADLQIAYSKGSLLVTNSRLVHHVANRLRPPSDGDIVVPGETVTITGTTSVRVNSLDHLSIPCSEVDLLIREASRTVPVLANARFIRAYAGVRPLVRSGHVENGDRGLSRTFSVFDHEQDGLDNFVTIAGGKFTTYRLMAEKTADLVARRLGVTAPCQTASIPLPGSERNESLDNVKRLERLQVPPPGGQVICECEMVGRAQIEEIINELRWHEHLVNPNAIRLRSRLGMGSCQGGFCGFRTIGLMYEKGLLSGSEGNAMLRNFLEQRWTGTRPMLFGDQLRQEQLLEAIYCGTLNIDGDL
jgi:glycerol-3-phosphate dehydrogenase